MKIKLMLKNFITSSSGNIAGQFLGFLVAAYLGRVLGPGSYGIFNFTQSYVFYFYIVTDLGLSLYLIKEANQNQNSKNIYQDVFTLRFYLGIAVTIIYFISLTLFNRSLLTDLSLYTTGISIFFFGMFIDSFFTARNNMKYIGMAQFIKNLVFFLLSLLMVKTPGDVPLAGFVYSLGYVFASAFLIYQYKSRYSLKIFAFPKLAYFRLLKFALPLAISLFMIQINNNFDILYLSFFKQNVEVGYYSAAYKIINFLIAILVVYFNASYSTVAELIKYDKKQLNAFIKMFYKMGMIFTAPITMGGFFLAGPIMVTIFGSSFSQSTIYLKLLLPLIVVRMITSTYIAILIMGGRGKQMSYCVGIGALINVLLNVLLVPNYGGEGSAIATLVCECVQGVLLYVFYRKMCHGNLVINTVRPLLASLVMGVIVLALNMNLYLSIITGIIVYAGLYSLIDLKFVIFIVRKIKRRKLG
jgi:O-antigen/teichoic acid export membrane protein